MKLDATDLRYITSDEFRVLSAVEQASKNHLSVPTPLIAQLSNIKGPVNKLLGQLAKRGLVGKVMNVKYDGYRLTYGGYDYLSLHTFARRKPLATISSVGSQIGVGKEGDVYVVKGKGRGPMFAEEDAENQEEYDSEEEDEDRVLKIHRLGRISFRAIKSKRDYLAHRKSASWMYMSRLAAEKEVMFMRILFDHGFPVPKPFDQSRHCIVMSKVDGFPLRSIESHPSPHLLFAELMALLVRLALHGLLHCDFNEFNIMILDRASPEDGSEDAPEETKDEAWRGREAVVIDFPQMVSVRHENAEFFFNRDVSSIRKFFRKRFRYESEEYPTWRTVMTQMAREAAAESAQHEEVEVAVKEVAVGKKVKRSKKELLLEEARKGKYPRLDLLVEASGFGRAMQEELEEYMNDVADLPGENIDSDSEEEEDSGEEEDEEEEERDEDQERNDLDENEEALPEQVGSLGIDSGSETDSDLDGPPQLVPAPQSTFGGTNYTSLTSRSRRPKPTSSSAGGSASIDPLRKTVAQDLLRARAAAEGKHGLRKTTGQAGKAKGHKWKGSKAVLVGKGMEADGW